MKLSWRSELPHWLILASLFALALLSWPSAPERIPVHWGLDWQVDRYGGKFEGLMGPPLIGLGLYLLLLILPRFDPGRANYARFAGAYATLRLALLALVLGVEAIVLLWIRSARIDTGAAMSLLLGAFFIVVGNLLGKLRPNWFLGIRTPWTLSSKRAWVKTHRLGGWMFIASGLVLMLAGTVHARWSSWLAAAVLGASLIALVLYSYLVWRSDPDKTPPAGTLPA